MIHVEELARLEMFADLPADFLEWLAGCSEELTGEPGAVLWEKDTPADSMFVLFSGALQILFEVSGQTVPITVDEPGAVGGLLPYSRMEVHGGRAVITERLRGLLLHRDHFTEMVARSPELGQRLVGMMSDRVRRATQAAEQREKMMALGKLAAGLAHELNNPAAAVRRTVADLTERLDRLPATVASLACHGLPAERITAILEGALAPAGRGGGGEELGALDRSDREDEVADWLEERGAEDGYLLAESLVVAGLTTERLEELTGGVTAAAVPDLVAWLEGWLAARQLLGDIASASERISHLVASIKLYSHMDRTPDPEPTDITAGLEATVTMLGHKLHKRGIAVERRYAPDLPQVAAYSGELNQVWTNLIDNAAGAMDDGGTLTLEAEVEGDCLVVRVIDDGHGIPEELQSRIFEPFFTTKGVGEGSGLGLEIVHRIVNQLHGGSIDVDSEPGRTAFTVWLPLEANGGG